METITSFFAEHLYLLAALYFAFWWALFFSAFKDQRRAMLIFGFWGMLLGPLVQQMHLIDWWHPNFVFNTPVKLEDVLFGLAVPGVAAAAYGLLRTKVPVRQQAIPLLLKITLVATALFLLFGLFYLFGVSSFWSSILSLCVSILFIVITRPQLLCLFFVVGMFLVALAVPGYLLGIHLNPHWIENEWWLPKLSGRFVFGIPVEELAWFFFTGAGLAAAKEILFAPVRVRDQHDIKK